MCDDNWDDWEGQDDYFNDPDSHPEDDSSYEQNEYEEKDDKSHDNNRLFDIAEVFLYGSFFGNSYEDSQDEKLRKKQLSKKEQKPI